MGIGIWEEVCMNKKRLGFGIVGGFKLRELVLRLVGLFIRVGSKGGDKSLVLDFGWGREILWFRNF